MTIVLLHYMKAFRTQKMYKQKMKDPSTTVRNPRGCNSNILYGDISTLNATYTGICCEFQPTGRRKKIPKQIQLIVIQTYFFNFFLFFNLMVMLTNGFISHGPITQSYTHFILLHHIIILKIKLLLLLHNNHKNTMETQHKHKHWLFLFTQTFLHHLLVTTKSSAFYNSKHTSCCTNPVVFFHDCT